MQLPYRKPGKYSLIPHDFTLSEEKFRELSEELEELKKKKLPAMAEVARLSLTGDFSENAGYQFAKGRLRGINAAITKLEQQVQHAVIIQPTKTGRVQVGSTVVVEVNNKEKTFQILGSEESDPAKNIISHHSPIGAALLDHKVGEIVEISLANKNTTFTIKKIV